MERFKTVEECAAYLGYDPKAIFPSLEHFPEKDRAALETHAKRLIVVDALNRQDNEGKEWFPDWGNWDEYKYTPYFDMGGSSGSGFACDGCVNWNTYSFCGSRLCFKSKATMKYAVEQFKELFETEFLKQKQ